jgi:hypothetical protein
MALTPQTGSRIGYANLSVSGWVEAANVDVTGWDTANDFVIACYALSDSVNPDDDFKLQWRRAGGSFADVGADTEVCWAASSPDLVDGEVVATAAGVYAVVDTSCENVGDNLAVIINVANGDYSEVQFALGFGSGVQASQEYEFQQVAVNQVLNAVLQTTITTAAAVAGVSKKVRRRRKYLQDIARRQN